VGEAFVGLRFLKIQTLIVILEGLGLLINQTSLWVTKDGFRMLTENFITSLEVGGGTEIIGSGIAEETRARQPCDTIFIRYDA
jgi:hypothetical protein